MKAVGKDLYFFLSASLGARWSHTRRLSLCWSHQQGRSRASQRNSPQTSVLGWIGQSQQECQDPGINISFPMSGAGSPSPHTHIHSLSIIAEVITVIALTSCCSHKWWDVEEVVRVFRRLLGPLVVNWIVVAGGPLEEPQIHWNESCLDVVSPTHYSLLAQLCCCCLDHMSVKACGRCNTSALKHTLDTSIQ